MNEILKVDFDTQMVSARELHEQLHIKTAFKDWFPRMCEYGFEEGKDFCSKLSETSEKGGRPSKDADISVDMAKQICMIQRTPEGKAKQFASTSSTLRRHGTHRNKSWQGH